MSVRSAKVIILATYATGMALLLLIGALRLWIGSQAYPFSFLLMTGFVPALLIGSLVGVILGARALITQVEVRTAANYWVTLAGFFALPVVTWCAYRLSCA